MNKNFRIIIFFIVVTLPFAMSINAQNNHRFSVSVSAGISKTGSLTYGEQYRQYDISPTINIISTASARNNNYNFSLGYQPTRSLSINGSIGVAAYGFQYTGDVIASPVNFISPGGFVATESFYSRLMEVALSASYRIAQNESLTFILQPGIAWYTNPREAFPRPLLGINMNSNNFSALLFAGVEIPITNNSFYITVGLNSKIALDNFAYFSDFENTFQPYAFGLQTSISYRFGSL